MSAALDKFVAELRAGGGDEGEMYADAIEFLIVSDDTRAVEITDSVNWIARQPRTLREKIEAVGQLVHAEQTFPKGHFNLREFVGW